MELNNLTLSSKFDYSVAVTIMQDSGHMLIQFSFDSYHSVTCYKRNWKL